MANQWIEDRLLALGKTKSGLAEAMGVAPSRVSEIVGGRRNIALSELDKIAQFLNLSREKVLGLALGEGADRELETTGWVPRLVRVRGIMQAGAWAERSEMAMDDQEEVHIAADFDRFPRIFVVKVAGLSMNRIMPPGTLLTVVPVQDYDRPIASGLYVVCQRVEHGKFESTVKQLEERGGHYWLWPRSTEPQFQTPIAAPDPAEWMSDTVSAGATDGIYIIGIVIQMTANLTLSG